VEIAESGEVTSFAFVTDRAKIGKEHGESVLFPASSLRSKMKKQEFQAYRLNFFLWWASNVVSSNNTPALTAIEGYAYGKGNNAYHIGEFGGVLRSILFKSNSPYIAPTPRALKTRANLKGKEKPVSFCAKEFGVDWTKYNSGQKADSAGDLADAHVLAQIALEFERGDNEKNYIYSGDSEPSVWMLGNSE